MTRVRISKTQPIRGVKISYSFSDTEFGPCLIASTDQGICAVLFADDEESARADLVSRWPHAVYTKERKPDHETMRAHLAEETASCPDLHLMGTEFQLRVWDELLSIKKGEVRTYAEIAALVGGPSYARAVGTAIGNNPISYVVPCHRVLASDGKMGGYRWGLELKHKMLVLEGNRGI